MGNRRFEHRAGIRRTLVAMACGLVFLAGCAAAPWPWGPRSSSDTKPAPSDAKTTSPSPSKSSGSQADSQALQQVMSELQQVGALDPVAQDKLMADLKQVDPSLWPMVLQTFRAEAAYKRREEQREAERRKEEAAAADSPREDAGAKTTVAGEHETRFELKPLAGRLSASGLAASKKEDTETVAPQPSSLSIVTGDNRPALSPEPPLMGGMDTSSTAGTAVAGPGEASLLGGLKPTLHQAAPSPASATPAEPPTAAERLAATRAEATGSAVVPAGVVHPAGTAPLSEADWQAHLTAAIHSIESESTAGSKNESDIALQARLRMLYLLAGRRDDAMRPLPAAPQASQDYWLSQIYGLSTWMDAEKTPDMGRRAAETKRILGEALAQLGETAPLAVRNLTFCTEVSRFGSFEALKSTAFTPGQKVLLYAEVDNLHIESSAKGYHWAVKVTGQIFDNRGNRMADYGSTTAEETYQTPRHDFFVSKLYYLPRLVPGRYTLQLTIEDTLGHKVGQSSLDFTIKPQ